MRPIPTLQYAPAGILVGATLLELQIPTVDFNAGNLFVVGACALAVVLVLLVARREGPVVPRLLLHDRAYLVYVAYVGLTTVWSRSPLGTAVQCVYLFTIWAGCFACARADRQAAAHTIYRIAVVTAVLSLLMLAVYPSYALQPHPSSDFPELRGIFEHQLRLGLFLSTALGLVAVATFNGELKVIFRRPAVAVPALGLLAVTTAMAFARLYTLAAIAAFGACIFLVSSRVVRTVMAASIVTVIVLLAINWLELARALHLSAATLTLSGRTLIWAKTLVFAGPGLVLGNGFGTFNHPSFDHLFPFYRPEHPHNSFIQAYFETGYIGLALTLVVIATHLRATMCYWRRFRKVPYSYYLLALTLLGSLFGSNYAGKPTFLFAALILMIGIESRLLPRETVPHG